MLCGEARLVPDQPAGGYYGYDWVGNRLNPPTGDNHMVYNKADQLTTWPGMHTYTYYGDGSLHEVKDASGTNVLRSYTYTPDGLLDTATYNSRTLTNTWDASRNRVSFTAGSTTHTFVYDTTAGIPAVIQEDGVYYVREPGGLLIARVSGTDMSYYHFDSLGSTRLLTDADGDVTDKYAYDAYGSLISHDELAGSVDQPYQYVGRYGYYTHYQEPEFGLMQLGVRFYDAEMGRFAARDLLRDDGNNYAYAGLQPIVAIDPLGLAYIVFKGKKICLYHDDGRKWMCCDAESGGANGADPIAPGIYRLDPDNIRCCSLSSPKWFCSKDSWGNWRCHLEPVKIKPDCEEQPHDDCFIHGGCRGRGTLGCIRIPDRGSDAKNSCLERLMNKLKKIGTPIRVTVPGKCSGGS